MLNSNSVLITLNGKRDFRLELEEVSRGGQIQTIEIIRKGFAENNTRNVSTGFLEKWFPRENQHGNAFAVETRGGLLDSGLRELRTLKRADLLDLGEMSSILTELRSKVGLGHQLR